MAANDTKIAELFVQGKEVPRGLLRRTRGNGPWGGTQHNLHANEGTVRFKVAQHHLVSYERWSVAVRLDSGMIILNADDGPSMTTKAHQLEAREAVKRLHAKHAFLPFSALSAARVDVDDIEVIATTADRTIPRKVADPKADGGFRIVQDHFLGEVLFRHRGRLYVSGLDRNDESKRRKFFLARLPEGAAAKTIDEALKALRPKGLPKDTLRQGEWFLVPSQKSPSTREIVKDYADKRDVWVRNDYVKPYRGVPIIAAESDTMFKAITGPSTAFNEYRELRNRGLRHVASRVYLNGAVYVSGMLRDAEHGPLKLGDGKTWYKVVRNLADGSWGATGDVD